MTAMRIQHSLAIFGVLMFALVAWGQDTPQSPSGNNTVQEQQTPQPVPAYGQENAPPPISENPPLSGLDLPSLEPHAAPLSYVQPGATVSESADSNVGNVPGGNSFTSVTRAIGSVTLQRLWSHYDLALDYFGGAAYYDEAGLGWKALQQADIDQKITWRRGQLSLRDSFSYLPEGNFGGAYGSTGSQGIAGLGTTAFGTFWGGSALGTLGLAPRIMNLSLADVSENLTPKSAITAAGGYALTHFYGNSQTEGEVLPIGQSLIGSSQISAQVGYDRLLSAHSQAALVYGYQNFNFSVVGTAFHSQIIQVMFGHRISGRMDFLIAAGPQFTHLDIYGTPDFRIGGAGQARLRYKMARTSFDLSYQRFLTAGSGFFAGAQTDMARLTADRQLNRVWSAFADIGYSRNSRFGAIVAQGVNANDYAYGFIGGGVHRAFGHNFHGFASYQFNELTFDQSFCANQGTTCSRIGNRQVITVGLDWTPRPIRID